LGNDKLSAQVLKKLAGEMREARVRIQAI
jgi:hypothetical protein